MALLNTFRTYEWTYPYQPLDYSFKYMQLETLTAKYKERLNNHELHQDLRTSCLSVILACPESEANFENTAYVLLHH